MKYPVSEFLGKTWIGWLNFLVLQWLFIRLRGVSRGRGCRILVAWEIRFALPLTGCWSGYIPQGVYWRIWKF